MSDGGTDPSQLRVLAVRVEDLVAALEDRLRRDGETVLRLTPPFHGRMRARLHVERAGEYADDEPTPIHVDPRALVAEPPPYPEPAETEDELRADPEIEYTSERHRERHVDAVERWRETVRDRVVEEAVVETPNGSRRVEITLLG